MEWTVMKEISERRSIRKYENRPIEPEKIALLLESARLAPSGNNAQPFHLIVITDEAVRAKVAEISHNQQWMRQAPLFIACVADLRARITDCEGTLVDENSPEMDVKRVIRDTAIAAEHIVLQAEHLGLGTCWIGWFIQAEIKALLNIPQDKFVVTVLTVGYPAEHPSPRPRKTLEELVHHEGW
ncbi:MAG TPA: nitroreductase family protein [Anaerolineaceae bacterium]|nr:nitroreductase family protein [Anaerolineaceae bacterium]HPN52200.1 nitroreductase family protein [Anaerolineaceae bacterium]